MELFAALALLLLASKIFLSTETSRYKSQEDEELLMEFQKICDEVLNCLVCERKCKRSDQLLRSIDKIPSLTTLACPKLKVCASGWTDLIEVFFRDHCIGDLLLPSLDLRDKFCLCAAGFGAQAISVFKSFGQRLNGQTNNASILLSRRGAMQGDQVIKAMTNTDGHKFTIAWTMPIPYKILGCVGDFICLYNPLNLDRIVIYTPQPMEIRGPRYGDNYTRIVGGFGVVGSLWVILFLGCRNDNMLPQYYTSSRCYWSTAQIPPFLVTNQPAVCVNSCLYWAGRRHNPGLLIFDMVRCTFELEVLHIEEENCFLTTRLGVVGNYLMGCDCYGTFASLWLWVNQERRPFCRINDDVERHLSFKTLQPLFFSLDGALIFLKSDKRIFAYDLETKTGETSRVDAVTRNNFLNCRREFPFVYYGDIDALFDTMWRYHHRRHR